MENNITNRSPEEQIFDLCYEYIRKMLMIFIDSIVLNAILLTAVQTGSKTE